MKMIKVLQKKSNANKFCSKINKISDCNNTHEKPREMYELATRPSLILMKIGIVRILRTICVELVIVWMTVLSLRSGKGMIHVMYETAT
jgi:hypothetical protein